MLSLRKYQRLCSSRFLETQHSKVHGSVGRTILVQNPKVGSLSAVTSVFAIVLVLSFVHYLLNDDIITVLGNVHCGGYSIKN